jgi:hypothetical protein
MSNVTGMVNIVAMRATFVLCTVLVLFIFAFVDLLRRLGQKLLPDGGEGHRGRVY